MIKLTRSLTKGCEDQTCPDISETDYPGMLGVTGRRLTLRERWHSRSRRGRGEVTNLIPEDKFHEAALERGYVRL